MEWLLVNPHLHNIFASLGCQVGDQYVAHPNCSATLDHIMKKLDQEDRTLRTFRRAIVFSNLIKKDLFQLLISKTDDRIITNKTVKLFAELTLPVENLLPVDVMIKTDAGRTTIIELDWLLFSAKESFLEPKSTRRILEVMKMLFDDRLGQGSANEDTLTDCISLLRNILHVPERRPTSNGNPTSYQNRLIWNLFSQNFDKLLINLVTRHRWGKWKLGLVQLIVLLYKDQQEIALQKLLAHWSEAISESSEDNESNTSPPDDYSRTSDRTSDSSDNSISYGNEKHKAKSSPLHKKLSASNRKPYLRVQAKKSDNHERDTLKHRPSNDSGCDTLGENPESGSTSSNDESPERKMKPVHQKPGNMIHKQRQPTKKLDGLSAKQIRELKMRKLHRRAINNTSLSGGSIYSINVTHVHQHNPTNDDISHLLKEFTVDFLISAYACIVKDLRLQIIDDRNNLTDSSHFFWLISYFLKFAIQLELDYESIGPVLSRDVVTFLVYQGVFLCEQYENSRLHSDFDMTSRLRKQHLIVTSIREILLALKAYMSVSYISLESKELVSQLQKEICEMEDLRNLFVLMLRQYNPDVHCRSYMIDLICTNHILIDSIEKCSFVNGPVIVQNHLKQFTAVEIMRQYGYQLGFYQENGPTINNCILTMMHHVAGDLDCLSSLLQPSIIRVFTLVYENGSPLLDDWSDLIEYVTHQFVASNKCIKNVVNRKTAADGHNDLVNREWSRDDCDVLYWYFVQSANSSDPVESIIQLYSDSGVHNKTRITLIEQLLKQDIISDTQFNEMMAKEPIMAIEKEKSNSYMKKGVEHLKDQLICEGMGPLITWVQKELLRACQAKLNLSQDAEGFVETVPYYYAMKDEAIPLVPWNCEQYSAMQSHTFLLFLHKLGFQLPADTGHFFARIPKSWSLMDMYIVAIKLGEIPDGWNTFDVADLQHVPSSSVDMPST